MKYNLAFLMLSLAGQLHAQSQLKGPSLKLGTAGVTLTQDGDGAITLTGNGNGSDEAFTFNLDDTANTVVLSSSTGVTAMDFGSIGIVSALSPRIARTDLAAGTALTVGTHYWVALSAIRTLTFSGSPADGDEISLSATVTGGPHVLTVPTSYRIGTSSTTTTISLPTGNHLIRWTRINSTWVMTDSGVDAEAAYTFYGNPTSAAAAPAMYATDTPAVGEVLSWQASGDLRWIPAGAGTVTSASVVSANGFAGTVATATTTPAITLTTSITGMLKGNGTAISAATAGTDYGVPSGYALQTEFTGSLTWSDSTTYYYGVEDTTSLTYDTMKMTIPKTGTLKAICVRCSWSVAGTSETVTVYARINGATDVGTLTFATNVGTIAYVNDFAVSQAVTQGDFIAIKIVTPAFATNPTNCRIQATFYITE